jgi:hypothetical protein
MWGGGEGGEVVIVILSAWCYAVRYDVVIIITDVENVDEL